MRLDEHVAHRRADSQVAFGALGCDVSLNDLCDRPPRALEDGEVIDLGGKRLRQISTPHVPHGWEAQVLFEETTRHAALRRPVHARSAAPAALTTDDVVDPAMAAEAMFHATCIAPHTGDVLRALGDLEPTTLAIMHGPSFQGDGRKALYDLAAGYEALAASEPRPSPSPPAEGAGGGLELVAERRVGDRHEGMGALADGATAQLRYAVLGHHLVDGVLDGGDSRALGESGDDAGHRAVRGRRGSTRKPWPPGEYMAPRAKSA